MIGQPTKWICVEMKKRTNERWRNDLKWDSTWTATDRNKKERRANIVFFDSSSSSKNRFKVKQILFHLNSASATTQWWNWREKLKNHSPREGNGKMRKTSSSNNYENVKIIKHFTVFHIVNDWHETSKKEKMKVFTGPFDRNQFFIYHFMVFNFK